MKTKNTWTRIRKAIGRRDKYICHYCGTECIEDGHVDHIVPVSQGGDDSYSNLVWSCSACNKQKFDDTPNRKTTKSKKGRSSFSRAFSFQSVELERHFCSLDNVSEFIEEACLEKLYHDNLQQEIYELIRENNRLLKELIRLQGYSTQVLRTGLERHVKSWKLL